MRKLIIKILLITCLTIFNFITPLNVNSQTKGEFLYIIGDDTSHVPFMYIGSDTLDYSDGGTNYIKVKINFLSKDSSQNYYIVEGEISEKIAGFSYEDYGLVMLGRIELIVADTWIGRCKTGLIMRDTNIISTTEGKFRIIVPVDYNNSLIFTGFGATVVEIPFKKLIEDVYEE